jgi:Uma2 family endonuclease
MEIEVARKLFTVDEYYQMAAAGILTPEDRVELIDREIIQMSPIGDRHAGCVNTTNNLFVHLLSGAAVVSVRNPLQLNDYTEPEPDLVVLKPRPDFYRGKKARAEDALLVLEVSDTTLRYDQTIKVPRYAAASIPEVWIENLETDDLLVYRNPTGQTYSAVLRLHGSDAVSPVAFPQLRLRVDELLG